MELANSSTAWAGSSTPRAAAAKNPGFTAANRPHARAGTGANATMFGVVTGCFFNRRICSRLTRCIASSRPTATTSAISAPTSRIAGTGLHPARAQCGADRGQYRRETCSAPARLQERAGLVSATSGAVRRPAGARQVLRRRKTSCRKHNPSPFELRLLAVAFRRRPRCSR